MRTTDLLNGKTDFASIFGSNLGEFLNASSIPLPYNKLLPNLTGEFNFSVIQSLDIWHLQMLVHRTPADHNTYGVSPLEGDCSPSPNPGCLVREGIIAGFNYTAYIEKTDWGLGRKVSSFIPEPFLDSENQAVSAGFLRPLTQNLTYANKLFQSAGYNSTRPLNLNCAFDEYGFVGYTSCSELASDLATLKDVKGQPYVKVTPVNVCTGCFANQKTDYQSYDLFEQGWGWDYADEDDFAHPYAASSGYFMSSIGYQNSSLDSLVSQAATTVNPTLRQQLYFQVMRTVQDDCNCYLFLSQPQDRTIWVASVSGFQLRGTNPAFLSYMKDLTKTSTHVSTGTFGSSILYGGLTMIFAISTVVFFLLRKRRTILSRIDHH